MSKVICVIMSNRRAFNEWAEAKNLRINRAQGSAEDIDNGDIYYHCMTKDQIYGRIFSVILMPQNDLYTFALANVRNSK